MQQRIFLIGIVVVLIVIGALPVAVMLLKSLRVNGHWTLTAYQQLIHSRRLWMLMGNSFTLSALVTFFTMLVGVPLGLLLAKTDIPFRHLWGFLFVIPLLIPPYITAISWFDLLGRQGILSQLWGNPIAEKTSHWLFGLAGSTWVLWSTFLPIPMLLTLIALHTVNPHLEEAARLTSRWPKVLVRITFPIIRPVLWLAAILVFLLTFGEYGVPGFLRYDVFPVESFIQFSAFYNFQSAVATAIPLVGITLLIILLEARFLKEHTYQLRPVPQGFQSMRISLGRYRWWAAGFVGFLAFVLVILPIFVLVVQTKSWWNFWQAFRQAFSSLAHSLLYAGIGASLLSLLGFFVGYLVQRKEIRAWRAVDSLTLFLFALPSTVTGIGLISLWNTPLTNFIYATPTIIVLGYLAKYTALSSRITVTQLAQIPPSVEEAAQTVGAGWFRRIAFIVLPLARHGLLASWVVSFIFTLRDTGITMLVYPPGKETLPVSIYTLMANGDPHKIAALCLVMLATVVLPAGLFGKMASKRLPMGVA